MSKYSSPDYIQAVVWRDDILELLDQRLLPGNEIYISCKDAIDIFNAIKDMVVRGAPAIGITAAYGTVLSAYHHKNRTTDIDEYKSNLIKDLEKINSARPTAVNLKWATLKAKNIIDDAEDLEEISKKLLEFATKIHEEDITNNELMGEIAHKVMSKECTEKCSVITHCNAGSLATGGYGTALGAIRTAYKHGLIEHVYADETRPWLQGSRLTAWELKKSGIPVSLNTEGATAMLMAEKDVRWIIVGADRIAANGDVANKIGTFSLAIIAKFHNVKVMVVAPSSTVDMNTGSGSEIIIEHRDSEELVCFKNELIAPNGVSAYNPVFDVTPAALIDYIVTEKGYIHLPDTDKLKAMFL